MHVILALFAAVILIPLNQSVADDSSFKLGVIVPLSGPVAEYGVATRNGMEIFRKDRPSACRSLELLFEDSKYDGAASVAAYRNLITFSKADAIYVWGTTPAGVIGPLVEREQIPTFAVTVEPRNLPWKWTVRADNYADQFAEPLASYIAQKGVRHLVAIKTNLPYLDAMSTALGTRLPSNVRFDVLHTFNPDEHDFRTTVAKIRAHKPDAIAVYLMVGQIGRFFAQANEQRLHIPAFGTDDFGSSADIKAAQGGMEGAVFASNQVGSDFQESYSRVFGNTSQISYAAKAHDFLAFLCRELDAAAKP